jgi:Sodium/calcium exchanger protein
VVIGSNVFNLAALLGLGAVVAGRIGLHRKVVLLGGTVAMGVAGMCLSVVLGVVPPAAGCLLGLLVVASVTMERAAAALGSHFAIPEIVVGGLVLAAVTSLPNAVAAVYLAGRGRGAATLSTALNSNAINVTAGLLIPAALIGLDRPSGQTVLATAWYAALTAAVLAFAYRDRGIWRVTGILVIGAYFVFVGSVLGLAYAGPQATGVAILAGLAVAVVFAAWLALDRHPDARNNHPGPAPQRPARPDPDDQVGGTPAEISANGSSPQTARARIISPSVRPRQAQESLLAGWPVRKLWVLGLAASLIVAAIDAALGNRAILIGLLIVGPCCAVLTGRWVPTGLTGLWVTGLAVVLGFPDGIWGTAIFFTWLGAVAVVALASTAAAAFIQTLRPARPR